MELLDSIFVHVGLSTENNINKDFAERVGMAEVCWGLGGRGVWGAGPESALRPLDLAGAGVVDGEVVRVGRVRQAELRRGIRFLPTPVSLFVQLVGFLLAIAFETSVLCTFELHDVSFG